jgi:hypothetical protein
MRTGLSVVSSSSHMHRVAWHDWAFALTVRTVRAMSIGLGFNWIGSVNVEPAFTTRHDYHITQL